MLLHCLLLISLSLVASSASALNGTVYYRNDAYEFKSGVLDRDHGVAFGTYDETLNQTGWNVLEVAAGYSTGASYSDEQIMMAAGFLEGALSQHDIYVFYQNMYLDTFSNVSKDALEKVKMFYQSQREWMEGMIQSNHSDHWYYTGLIYAQFQGLVAGYAAAAPANEQLEEFAFDFLSGNGDYLDIENFLVPDQRPDASILSKEDALRMMYSSRCSVLIKVLPAFENIFASHSTWYIYTAMTRVYKHYSLKLSKGTPATEVMSFSSYPAYLSSVDDFFIMDSGLVMLQTTNNIFNKTLYDLATPHALLAWHRVRLANWLATGGLEWAGIFSQYNSGTYNNQYMVLDLKRFQPNKALLDGSLVVVEQIPGKVESGDQTDVLQAGYWPSYNIPFYEDIFRLSGYAEMVAKFGTDLSYQLCPRAKIFRRDQGNVHDMDSMKYIMRYNDYTRDPYSQDNAMYAICSRGDLANPPSAGGCLDTKVTDSFMAQSLTAYAESGPTHQGLPPFNWMQSKLTVPHVGQPNIFDFGFVKMTPTLP